MSSPSHLDFLVETALKVAPSVGSQDTSVPGGASGEAEDVEDLVISDETLLKNVGYAYLFRAYTNTDILLAAFPMPLTLLLFILLHFFASHMQVYLPFVIPLSAALAGLIILLGCELVFLRDVFGRWVLQDCLAALPIIASLVAAVEMLYIERECPELYPPLPFTYQRNQWMPASEGWRTIHSS
jgi:hypothetical protein